MDQSVKTLPPVWPLRPRQTVGWWMLPPSPLTRVTTSVTIGQYADYISFSDFIIDTEGSSA